MSLTSQAWTFVGGNGPLTSPAEQREEEEEEEEYEEEEEKKSYNKLSENVQKVLCMRKYNALSDGFESATQ